MIFGNYSQYSQDIKIKILLSKEDMSQNSVVLGYWKIRGLAQRIRMTLQYVNLPYTQVKYDDDNQKQWYEQEKPNFFKVNPAANLPYLIDGDKIICESDAIITYILHKTNHTELLGRNASEQVLIATVMGVFRDYHKKYIGLVYGSKENFENRANKIAEWNTELTKLNTLLNGKEFFCGGLTWVDFVVSQNIQALSLLDPLILEPYQNLANHMKRVWDLEQMKKYHGSNRWNERPVNYPTVAAWY